MLLALLLSACATEASDFGSTDAAYVSDGSLCGDGRDGNLYFRDADGDGHGDPSGDTTTACRTPQGYADVADDCDDADASVRPGAREVCDGLDNDCDGAVDPTDARGATTWFADADADGFGDPNEPFVACEAIAAYVVDNTDCDDGDADVSPAGIEVCDGLDNDCDGAIDDEPIDGAKYYVDADGDFQGAKGSEPVRFCEMPLEGYSSVNYDCDDNPTTGKPIHTGADELCDGIDNDCDDGIDNDPVDGTEYRVDADADGFGDPGRTERACEPTDGLVEDGSDCDDHNPNVYPDADEICDAIDDDCDCPGDTNGDGWACGLGDDGVDEDAVDASEWFDDGDGDGWGDSSTGLVTCDPWMWFYSATALDGDCDPGDGRVFPGSDGDRDGYLGCADDCDDGNPDINPDVLEEGCSTTDLDCDGTAGIDEPTADCEVAVGIHNDGIGFTVTITVPGGFDAWETDGFEAASITLEPEDASYAAQSADYAGDGAATVIAIGRTGFTPYATSADGSTSWADMSTWYVDEAATDVDVVIYPDNTGTAANFLFAY